MIYLKGHLARPLDEALAHGSRVSALRVLHASPDGLSGRQIARQAGINHQSAALALHALERLGLVEKKVYDRATLWRLDKRKYLFREMLRALFEGEARFASELVIRIQSSLRAKADFVVVVGAAAKGRLAAGEPLEVVILCEMGRRRGLHEALNLLIKELDEEFGVALKASILGKREAPVRMEILDGWQLLPKEGTPTVFNAAR